MSKVAITIGVGLIILSTLASGEETWMREVVFETMPDSIQLPPGPDEFTLSEVLYISLPLRNVLMHFQLETIRRGFPDFNLADTLGIVEETGDTVLLANFSEVYVLKFPQGFLPGVISESLFLIPGVNYAEPNCVAAAAATWPDDYYLQQVFEEIEFGQWNLYNPGDPDAGIPPDADIDVADPIESCAWDYSTGNSTTKIAIIDGGIRKTHEDFKNPQPPYQSKVTGDNQWATGNNPWWHWPHHGTHVAGIAAAYTNNNGLGIAGIDWDAKLVSYRIDEIDKAPKSDDAGIANKVNDATANCHILNCSWGLSQGTPESYEPFYSITVRRAFANAYKLNRVAACAMMNDGAASSGENIYYPAGYWQGIIATGASDQADQRIDYSGTGPHIDVVAPGGWALYPIWSTTAGADDEYQPAWGTSMATPHSSGVAGLLRGYAKNRLVPEFFFNDDIEHIIQLSADDKFTPGWDEYTGYGRLNALKAFELLRTSPPLIYHYQTTGGTAVYDRDVYPLFFDTPGFPSNMPKGPCLTKCYEVTKTVTFPDGPFLSPPSVWGDGAATTGLSPCEGPWQMRSDGDWFCPPYYNFGMGWCEPVPGTITQTSCRLRTYIYKIFFLTDWIWVPCSPENVKFAYSVLPIDGQSRQKVKLTQKDLPTQIFPIPLSSAIKIKYIVYNSCKPTLNIYDASGRLVKSLITNQNLNPGYYEFTWDGKDQNDYPLPGGIYFCVIGTNEGQTTQKLLLIR